MIGMMKRVMRLLMGEDVTRWHMEIDCQEPKPKPVKRELVCVLCGAPWGMSLNRCGKCRGFCSWGYEKGGEPSSWHVRDGKWIPKKPSVRPGK